MKTYQILRGFHSRETGTVSKADGTIELEDGIALPLVKRGLLKEAPPLLNKMQPDPANKLQPPEAAKGPNVRPASATPPVGAGPLSSSSLADQASQERIANTLKAGARRGPTTGTVKKD